MSRRRARGLAAAALAPVFIAALAATPADRAVRTVCTVTVNSPDEKQALARHLAAPHWRFVELVEPGRADWLHAACRSGVRCDVLVISGHYDGGHQFFSDRLDAREHLPVAELERASCTPSCAGLFGALKEVYLFGCNTLNPQPQSSGAAEAVRSLVRERAQSTLPAVLPGVLPGRGESSRDRMRQIFAGVPVIYGFSSMAPLGPVAAESLEGWLRRGGAAQVAGGHASAGLLATFGGIGFTAVPGLRPHEPLTLQRAHMCALGDDDRPLAERVQAVHRLLQRDVTGAGVHLDRIQHVLAEIPSAVRSRGEVALAFARIADDGAARSRWLASTRETADPALRLRLIDVAHEAGWFTRDERREEGVRMLAELLERGSTGLPEVDLACGLNRDGELEGLFRRRVGPMPRADDLARAAIQACLGSDDARRQVLAALTGESAEDAAVAQAYLRQRPLVDAGELRRLADAVLAMSPGEAQLRALATLGRHYLSDRAILAALGRLYAETRLAEVQSAVAGILIRADRQALDVGPLLELLQRHRLGDGDSQPIVDALIRRLKDA